MAEGNETGLPNGAQRRAGDSSEALPASPPLDSRPSDAPEILRLERITKAFGENKVLNGVTIRLERGENVALIGKSGTGKSVLLRIIMGLMDPDDGEVFLWGKSTENWSDEDWMPYRRRMGMVFQSGALFDSMTVYDNVAFPLHEQESITEHEVDERVRERLTWVELHGVEDAFPSELSGGMRRRVALARTLAGNPEFVLYDEPTTGLDPVTGKTISLLMRRLNKRVHSTSIMVTHDIDSARIVSSRWIYLSGGRVMADGSPDELLKSERREVREFVAGR